MTQSKDRKQPTWYFVIKYLYKQRWSVLWEHCTPREVSRKVSTDMFRLVLAVLALSAFTFAFKVDSFVEDDVIDTTDVFAPRNITDEADLAAIDPEDDEIGQDGDVGAKGCPPGFRRYGNWCLHFSRTKVSWFEALTVCKFVMRKRSFLVEIRTRAMQRLLRRLIRSRRAKGEYWVGGTNLALGWKKLRWNTSFKPVGSWLWDRNEPNNVNHNEHCTELRHNGRLNDQDCQANRMFICARLA